MTLEEFEKQLERDIYSNNTVDIYTSPDFQSDQTEGFPVSLCVCFEKGMAWLELNEALVMDRDEKEMHYYRNCCAGWGIRDCWDKEQWNTLIHSLGEDAVQSAELPIEDDEEIGMCL